jgi:hypothetical protein
MIWVESSSFKTAGPGQWFRVSNLEGSMLTGSRGGFNVAIKEAKIEGYLALQSASIRK